MQSSRRLGREAGCNVEVMWLVGRPAPDHKTIADFRRDHGTPILQACTRFVLLCRDMGLPVSGRDLGIVAYNLKIAVETEHHLIVAHAVTNAGSDRAQRSGMAKLAKAVLEAETLDAVADRGYFSSQEILASERAALTVTLPKPLTSGARAEGRFGKQDFVREAEADAYRCPAGERLSHRCTNVEGGLTLRRSRTTACGRCTIEARCTPAKERRVTRWEREDALDQVQRRLDADPGAMRVRRATAEHPVSTLRARMGATHVLLKTLPRVSGAMALHIPAYNMTRVLNILGARTMLTALRA